MNWSRVDTGSYHRSGRSLGLNLWSTVLVRGWYLALQELEALLVEDLHELGLKVLVGVPGTAGDRAVGLQVI